MGGKEHQPHTSSEASVGFLRAHPFLNGFVTKLEAQQGSPAASSHHPICHSAKADPLLVGDSGQGFVLCRPRTSGSAAHSLAFTVSGLGIQNPPGKLTFSDRQVCPSCLKLKLP